MLFAVFSRYSNDSRVSFFMWKFSELLTHGGRALTDIQKYDKLIGSDDDDDDPGTIGADVVRLHSSVLSIQILSNNLELWNVEKLQLSQCLPSFRD